MSGIDPLDEAAILAGIKALAADRRFRLTIHATGRIAQHDIALAEIVQAIATATLLENYPLFYQAPACLIGGDTIAGRPIHIVCSTTLTELVIITVYEPKPPKWQTPQRRRE